MKLRFTIYDLRIVGACMLAAIAAGCAGYHLGPSGGAAAGARSVEIKTFINKTHEPRVTEYVAMALRRQLQVDGTYRLETSGSPDLILSGEITRLQRSGLSYTTNDILTPQEYVLTLTAHVVARETATGRTTFDREVHGTTFLRIGSDLSSSERQAIPILADDLARVTVDLMADGTW